MFCVLFCLLSYVFVFKLDELDELGELNVCAMQLFTIAMFCLPFFYDGNDNDYDNGHGGYHRSKMCTFYDEDAGSLS